MKKILGNTREVCGEFIGRPMVSAALVLALGFVAAAGVGGYSAYAVQGLNNALTVTGSATVDAKADSATWTISVGRSVPTVNVASTYTLVSSDVDEVRAYFIRAGVTEDEITTSTIVADQEWKSDSNAIQTSRVHQELTISSKDVQKIETLSKKVAALASVNPNVNAYQPQYLLSTLPEIRVSLLGKAVTDARARAGEIAKSGGSSVGAIKSASSGVVQVTAPDSISSDDYGSYDTTTINKKVMVTARVTFFVR